MWHFLTILSVSFWNVGATLARSNAIHLNWLSLFGVQDAQYERLTVVEGTEVSLFGGASLMNLYSSRGGGVRYPTLMGLSLRAITLIPHIRVRNAE